MPIDFLGRGAPAWLLGKDHCQVTAAFSRIPRWACILYSGTSSMCGESREPFQERDCVLSVIYLGIPTASPEPSQKQTWKNVHWVELKGHALGVSYSWAWIPSVPLTNYVMLTNSFCSPSFTSLISTWSDYANVQVLRQMPGSMELLNCAVTARSVFQLFPGAARPGAWWLWSLQSSLFVQWKVDSL